MSPNVKGKTIILTNPNTSQQKTIILRSVGPDGNTILQHVPLSSVSGLQNIGNTNNLVLTQGTGSNIIKTTTTAQPQFQQIQTIQQQQPQQQQQIVNYQPTGLVTSQPQTQTIHIQQQPQNQQGTRLLLTNNSGKIWPSILSFK